MGNYVYQIERELGFQYEYLDLETSLVEMAQATIDAGMVDFFYEACGL